MKTIDFEAVSAIIALVALISIAVNVATCYGVTSLDKRRDIYRARMAQQLCGDRPVFQNELKEDVETNHLHGFVLCMSKDNPNLYEKVELK